MNIKDIKADIAFPDVAYCLCTFLLKQLFARLNPKRQELGSQR